MSHPDRRPRRRIFLVPALAVLTACGDRSAAPLELPAAGPITLAVAGDTLLTQSIDTRDSSVAAVRDLVSGAALALANLDVQLLEDERQADAARAAAGGVPHWPFALPRDAATLRDLGIDVVSLANDHAADYGADGLASTRRVLARAGILDVGAGPDLAAARSPLFIGRSAGGRARIAVVAVATSSTSASWATASRADIQGRAGLNPLRYAPDVTVDPKTFQTLAETASAVGGARGASAGDTISLFGTVIKKGERTAVHFVVDERDEREILETIVAARRGAEFVIMSIHSHEPSNASAEPAEFVRRFARRAIDAGAHAVVGHGPHRIRAAEAYGGGIILFGVGDFVYQTADVAPGSASEFDGGSDLYARALGASAAPGPAAGASRGTSLVALLDLSDGRLAAVRLEPIALDEQGLPRIAPAPKRAEILEDLASLSASSGTVIRTDGSTAEVVLRDPPARP